MPTLLSQNRWSEAKCAKAFWGQQELPAYRRLLADTIDWASPGPGEHWLDLGCGGGAITRELWNRSGGRVAAILGVDCAATNESKYRRLRQVLVPAPADRIRFLCHDFNAGGLGLFAAESFDHVVSGLSISYAESYDETAATWTDHAYDGLLSEVRRVLRPGGRFVFSVNVPEPSWMTVAIHSLGGVLRSERPLRLIKKAGRMLKYGSWLKHEARRGRFHYLPAHVVLNKLERVGYRRPEHRLSYAGQAYIFRAFKP